MSILFRNAQILTFDAQDSFWPEAIFLIAKGRILAFGPGLCPEQPPARDPRPFSRSLRAVRLARARDLASRGRYHAARPRHVAARGVAIQRRLTG